MKTIIKQLRLENLSIPELAEAASQDFKEYIEYIYSHPGKYEHNYDFGYRDSNQKDIKYLECVWYKED